MDDNMANDGMIDTEEEEMDKEDEEMGDDDENDDM